MGNQTSATGGPVTDVTKLYSVETSPLAVAEEFGGFALLRGKRKRDNAPVLVFRCEKAKAASLGLCSNALKQAKKLRHPLILNLLDGVETDSDVFMVAEDATPLAVCLTDIRSDSQRAWGIRCLANVLSFLNEKCRLVHGNVSPWTVFVTPGGDWKLFGLELLDMECASPEGGSVTLPPLFRQAQWIPSAQYKAPERRKNDFRAMDTSPFWAIDSWSLGCVVLDVLEGRTHPTTSQTRVDAQADADRLAPSSLKQQLRQLLSPDSRSRLSPSAFIKSEYFSDIFVRSMLFLEELQLKAPEKREAFFKSLSTSAGQFPAESLKFKVIPLVAQAISFESKAVNAANVAAASGQPPPTPASVNVLLGMLDSLLTAEAAIKTSVGPTDGKPTSIDSAISDLFACNDRIVRVGLLQRIEKIALSTSADATNTCFDQICTGFSDATPVVRELTIKAMIHLVPRLNDVNKNDKLLRFLAKLQTDPEHAIRTNCVVCLGLIAPQLSADARRKTLTASFARAMKDPFVHARAAGLRGLISSHKLMGLDSETLATKVLPTVCPLLVDPAKEVRTLAFDAANALLKTLQEDLAKASQIPNGESSSSSNPISGASTVDKQNEGLLGMAVSFAASFAGSKPTNVASVPAASAPPAATAAVSSRPVSQQMSGAVRREVSWEEDEENNSMMLPEDDPDDFFMRQEEAEKKKSAEAKKYPSATSAPVIDIFANEDKGKLKPARLGKKLSTEPKPAPIDLLSDEDLDLFMPKPQPNVMKPHPVPPTGPKSNLMADDGDFFSSLMTGPSKRKT